MLSKYMFLIFLDLILVLLCFLQTADMQWTYNVRGVLPDYIPPRGHSSGPMLGPHPDPRVRREQLNFIRDNMRLVTTGVSSPIKGAPLMPRMHSGQVLY